MFDFLKSIIWGLFRRVVVGSSAEADNLALRHQAAVLQRQIRHRPKLTQTHSGSGTCYRPFGNVRLISKLKVQHWRVLLRAIYIRVRWAAGSMQPWQRDLDG